MYFAEALPGNRLPEVLKTCVEQGLTGALEVTGPSEASTIWLKGGRVLCASSAATLGLEEALLQLRQISPETLRELRQQDSPADVFLISVKGLPAPMVTYIRAFQTADTLYHILEWEKAGFEFREGQTPRAAEAYLAQTDWGQEMGQFVQEWLRIRGTLGPPKQVFKRNMAELPKDAPPQVLKLWELLDGRRSLEELILWSGINYLSAHQTLVDLTEKGWILPVSDGRRLAFRQQQAIEEVLRNSLKIPGVEGALLVDRSGRLIVQEAGPESNVAAMASIFSQTVDDFEKNLQMERIPRRIEQILVEGKNDSKTLLLVTPRVLLVLAASQSCDWGLLRLEAQRGMKKIVPLLIE